MILVENGKVLILDQEGQFVSTVYKAATFFTTIQVANDKLLLGTDRGQIHVYHMASLSYISEVPHQFHLLAEKILNNFTENTQTSKAGPPTRSIELTANYRFLKIAYADSSFVVVDRT